MPNFTLWIILGIATFAVCQAAVPGFIGAFIAIAAKNEWTKGSYETSLSKLRTAKTLVIINFVIGALVVFAFLGMMVFGTLAAA